MVDAKAKIDGRMGMQKVVKEWGEIAFHYIGMKNKDLPAISKSLFTTGVAEWDGVTLIKL